MENPNLFYQESNQLHPQRLLLSYLIGLVLAVFLGYCYALLIVLIPLIYLKAFITIGMGIALAMVCRFLSYIAHNRNKNNRVIQAILIGLFATCFQWVAYILYAYNGEIPAPDVYLTNLIWILWPGNFFTAILEINSVGMWSVFGMTFNGLLLAFVWLVETSIIIAYPVMVVYKAEPLPYSEAQGKWYPKYTLDNQFKSISGIGHIGDQLQANALEAIQNMGDGIAIRYCKIHVFFLEKEAKQYLTFERIFVKEGGRGATNSVIVINNFAIDTTTARLVLNKFKHKKNNLPSVL